MSNEDQIIHRLGVVKVSLPCIADVLQLPKDYELLTMHIDFEQRVLTILVTHPDIPVVGKLDPLPEVLPSYESRVDENGDLWTRLVQVDIQTRQEGGIADLLRAIPKRKD